MSQQFREAQAKWKRFYDKFEKKKAEKRRRERRKAFLKRILSHAWIFFYLAFCAYFMIFASGMTRFSRIFIIL